MYDEAAGVELSHGIMYAHGWVVKSSDHCPQKWEFGRKVHYDAQQWLYRNCSRTILRFTA